MRRMATKGEFETLTSAGSNVDKKRAVNLCATIGHFYVRKLLAVRVLTQVIHDLMGVHSHAPLPCAERVHLTCMVLIIIGPVMDNNGHGATLLTQFLAPQ